MLSTYLYPANMFNSVLFPAPDGPMTAVSSPDRNFPLTFFKITFWRFSTEYVRFENLIFTGGLFGRCVKHIVGFLCPFGKLSLFFSTMSGNVSAFAPLHKTLCGLLKKKSRMHCRLQKISGLIASKS